MRVLRDFVLGNLLVRKFSTLDSSSLHLLNFAVLFRLPPIVSRLNYREKTILSRSEVSQIMNLCRLGVISTALSASFYAAAAEEEIIYGVSNFAKPNQIFNITCIRGSNYLISSL